MNVTIQGIETVLLAQLAPLASTYNVQVGLFSLEELNRPTPVGQILLGYKRSRFGKPDVLEVTRQEWELEYELTFRVRDLRTHQGVYPLMDAARGKLVGFTPEGCLSVYADQEGYVSFDEATSFWVYSQSYVVPTFYTEGDS